MSQADGFALNDVRLYGLIAARRDPSEFKVAGKYLAFDSLGIMLSKADSEFRQFVDN